MPKAVRIALPIVLLAAVYAGWAPIEALTQIGRASCRDRV